MKNKISFISASLAALLIGGCSTASKQPVAEAGAQTTAVVEATQEQANAAALLKQLQAENARLAQQNAALSQASAPSSTSRADGDLLPPNAKPGECYARVLTPATYTSKTERVEKKPASYRLEVIPAKYTWGEDKILVQEEGEKLKIIPATHKWVEEKVLIQEASAKVISVPAKYKTVKEKVLVKPAYSTWKKGNGPIEKVNNATGEIMCLVEVPAEYKTVVREELVTAASTKKISIPAEYKIVKKRVVAQPEKIVKIKIPAKYKIVKVKKVLQPAQEKRIDIPAQYATITKRSKVTDSSLDWRSILCETNTTPDIIRRIQQALVKAGYNPGSTDGRIGKHTMDALAVYQKKRGLASGQITMETLKSLGVAY
jgi:hypothetical protein